MKPFKSFLTKELEAFIAYRKGLGYSDKNIRFHVESSRGIPLGFLSRARDSIRIPLTNFHLEFLYIFHLTSTWQTESGIPQTSAVVLPSISSP